MSKLQDTYSKNDWIVHTYYGVGQIKNKEQKVLGGEKHTFFRVQTFNCMYWLPVENTDVDYIRPLASKLQISRALTLIRKKPDKLPKKSDQRKQRISQVLRKASIFSKAKIIRDLNGRRFSKQLNFREERAYKKFKDQFLNEWSYVEGEDLEILEKKLSKALAASINLGSNGERENA